jgi:cytochrome c oxidase assembly protein subunit 15
MGNNKSYLRYTWFLLFMVFLVIIAGGVVRMTQSGMGCPDWPKCFGRWIPPTHADQLPADFEKYLRQQDIDHTFNVYHTWIEYINRLLGALLGVFIFIHFIWSYRKFRKTNRSVVLISFLLLLAVGFQGWLGKKVVDHNLAAVKITTHMVVALLIAALPLLIIYRLKVQERVEDKFLRLASAGLLLLLLVQIALGTQVREQIDEISKSLSYSQRELWIPKLDNIFLYHRSFSWIVAAGAILLYWKSRRFIQLRSHALFILSLVVLTAIVGIIMAWYDIPAIAQPLHLLLASTLALTVFALRLRLK